MARLTKTQVEELVHLYRDEGWRVMHLARKYQMPHASIQHHLAGVIRTVVPMEYCPEEIVEASAHVSGWKMNRSKKTKSYKEYLADEKRRREEKRKSCTHKNIAVICLGCGEHFEETKTRKAKVEVTFL